MAGVQTVYLNGETDTVAKSQSELQPGDTLEFLCDYYSYDGRHVPSFTPSRPPSPSKSKVLSSPRSM